MEPPQIPQRVIDRVLRRRGRLHVHESLDAASTALLVVDLQVHFMREGSPSEMPSARAIVPTVNRLAGALREQGGHVVWVVSTYGPDEERNWANLDIVLGEEAAAVFRDGLSEGAAGHAIWPALDVREGDPLVHKNRFGAFIGSQGRLAQVLRDLGVDTVLVVGTVTNVCCETTAREAAAYDFKTVMISDANAGRTAEEDAWTYAVCFATYGDVLTADEAIERLG
ncbi:MAG: cysteine hydrolase [Rhodospirillales bacterium]|nr:cysteine hydrolase [Rhodospirillales bacterium]MDE0380143.1 cysteine hydrolase [Rhodospirillales bacterium]